MFDNNAERQLGAYNFGLGQVCHFIAVWSQWVKPEFDSETGKVTGPFTPKESERESEQFLGCL